MNECRCDRPIPHDERKIGLGWQCVKCGRAVLMTLTGKRR